MMLEQRKRLVLIGIFVIFALGHWHQLTEFVVRMRLDVAAHWLQHEYLTGTAVMVLLVMIFLLPRRYEHY